MELCAINFTFDRCYSNPNRIMLSILIPVYNFDVRKLVIELAEQCRTATIPFEVILLDDASTPQYRIINKALGNLPDIRYEELPINVGRAKIRNLLLEKAQYTSLLFIDCDSALPDDLFIRRYLPFIGQEIIVYGGRVYEDEPPANPDLYLHWYYGTYREVMPVADRQKAPNQSFMTNNFLIHKSVFGKIRFNEVIRGYGHEDTLFGYELKKNNMLITHIDNPVVHIGLETSRELLRKSKNSIRNLRRILIDNREHSAMAEDISLLHSYLRARKLGIDNLISRLFKRFEPAIIQNLESKNPRLILFDLFKLGYLCSIKA